MEVLNEDWNEDFVFDTRDDEEGGGAYLEELDEDDEDLYGYDDKDLDDVDQLDPGAPPFEGPHRVRGNRPVRTPVDRNKACSVIVPQAIKERQANVHGDLGQVRDFALLVEELKRLRMIASSRGIVDGPTAELWHEADDIIDLASPDDGYGNGKTHNHSDNDHRHHQHPHQHFHSQQVLPRQQQQQQSPLAPPRSPSSPGFGLGFDPFDDDPSPVAVPSRKRRKSVLSLDGDFYEAPPAPGTQRERPPECPTPKPSPSLSRMPSRSSRHGSPSVARSVIDTMNQRRAAPSPSAAPPKKMPFDSTTLRELVAHVRSLSRRLAELVVIAESPLPSPSPSQSPHLSPPPSFGQVLSGSVASSPSFGTARPTKKSKSATEVLTPIKGKENELNGHILMAVI